MTFETIILLAAKKIGVSGTLLLAICTHESRLQNVFVPHDGGSPTYGICQVKEDTARMLGHKGEAKVLMNPEENAKWAAEYLKYQLNRYDNDTCKAVAAYNAGKYNESKKKPGYPRNYLYIKKVQKHIPEIMKHELSCWKIPMKSEK